MDTSAFNILERVVADKASDKGARRGPRIHVTKRSLIPFEFSPWFDGVGDRTGYAVSRLLASAEQRDWSDVFKLDELANGADRTVIELDHGYYSHLARNPHSEMVFSFSAPVSTVDGFLFYGTVDRGFLWAHGFLCRFQGTFDAPTALDYLNVWRS